MCTSMHSTYSEVSFSNCADLECKPWAAIKFKLIRLSFLSLGVSIRSADNTGAIVGGTVAGLLVIAGAVTAIVIVVLILRHRDHQSRLSIQQRDK